MKPDIGDSAIHESGLKRGKFFNCTGRPFVI